MKMIIADMVPSSARRLVKQVNLPEYANCSASVSLLSRREFLCHEISVQPAIHQRQVGLWLIS